MCAAACFPNEAARDWKLQRGGCGDVRRNGHANVRRPGRIAESELETEIRCRGGGQLGDPVEQTRPSLAVEQGGGKKRAQLAEDVGE